jgi:hypothetical protein
MIIQIKLNCNSYYHIVSSRFLSIICVNMQHLKSTLSICHGSPEIQEVDRVYNKIKRAFRTHRCDKTLVNEAIEHAAAIVNSVATISATAGTLAAEPDSEPRTYMRLKMYTWLVSTASVWRNPIMRDYVSIRYMTKQVAKHIDLLYRVSISMLSGPDAGAILFTESDRRTYLDMLEDYRQIITLL